MSVAAIGFVNAGLLSFCSVQWMVFDSNVDSSVTGWLVAWIGFKIKVDAFALPFIGLCMVLKLTVEGTRRGGLGMALAGFGVLFLGINMLKEGFGGAGPPGLAAAGGFAVRGGPGRLVGHRPHDFAAGVDDHPGLNDLRRAVELGYKAIQRLAALPKLPALVDGTAVQRPGRPVEHRRIDDFSDSLDWTWSPPSDR